MDTTPERRIAVLISGPSESSFYDMLAPFTRDPRFYVCAQASTWEELLKKIQSTTPDLVMLQAAIAPGPEEILQAMAMLNGKGVGIVILPGAYGRVKGMLESRGASTIAGVYVEPIVWAEMVEIAYSAVMTLRARTIAVAPAQYSVPAIGSFASGMPATAVAAGTKRIALVSNAGGVGRSTLAEALAYELANRLSVKTLLMSLGMPAAAVPHFRGKLRFPSNVGEYFRRPTPAVLEGVMQRVEQLDVLIAPPDSAEYEMAANQADPRSAGSIYSMLQDAEGQHAAVVMDLPPSETQWMTHPLLFANTILVVSRLQTDDLIATVHTLNVLLNALRKSRDSIWLVFNQVSDRSTLTPRSFQEEIAGELSWAPPMLAAIESDPAILQAQEQGVSPTLRSDKLMNSVREIANALYPGLWAKTQEETSTRAVLRLPRIRLGG